MLKPTTIAWTDFSTNPLKYRTPDGKIVWACVKTSPGCAHCYSEAVGLRFDRGDVFNATNMEKLTPFVDVQECRNILSQTKAKKIPVAGRLCFPFDMTDVFGYWVTDDQLDILFAMMIAKREVTWQVLTKRVERMADYSSRLTYRRLQYAGQALGVDVFNEFSGGSIPSHILDTHPGIIPNLWMGTSIENNKMLFRHEWLMKVSLAKVRFWSAEPLIEELVDAEKVMGAYGNPDWIIIGGESGSGAREMTENMALSLMELCNSRGVPVFFKQTGNVLSRRLGMGSQKGEDVHEKSAHLFTREYPDHFTRLTNE